MDVTPVEPRHRSLTLSDVTIHYVEIGGDGPPLVVLHGIGMDWRVWQSVSKRLADSFHLFAFDLRGHGQSGKPEHGYGLANYASDVEKFLRVLQLRGVILVGSSLGGMIAVVVEESAETVSGRVLVDPLLVRGIGRSRALFEQILHLKQAGVGDEEQRQAIFRTLQGDAHGAGNMVVRYMAETWTACAPAVLIEALHPVETPEQMAHALTEIDQPVLILRGNQDRGGVLSEAVAAEAVGLLPQGAVKYFPNSGHAIHGSEPGRFVATVCEFASVCVPAVALGGH
jgi:pimeloyl-ACP methyl ester carboxylesterase